MIKLTDISKDISFDEPTHSYTNREGKKLISVTSLLSLYKEEFDPTGIIAYKCGQRKGITKQAMQEEWKEINRIANEKGHKIHSELEFFLKNGTIQDTSDKDIIEQLASLNFKGKIFSELRLKSDKYSLAGTCDIAVLKKNLVTIHDLKTNKRFDTKSKYNKKFLYPLNNLEESHLTGYSLQILIYGKMVKEYGFDFKPGQILWINPETRKLEKYDVLDLSKEVDTLLNHHLEMLSW